MRVAFIAIIALHGNWTWLKLEITDIKYNVGEMPLVMD